MFLVDFAERISKWNVIVALAVALIALAVTLCARPMVNRWGKDRSVDQKEKIILRIKVVCTAVMVAACLLSVIF